MERALLIRHAESVRLVAKGAPYFYNNRRGTYTNRLARLAQRAIHLNIGLWKTCPHTTHNPNHALDTGQTLPTSRP